ncbi:hypothetical protein CTheo_5313 [Ceratobasidium theobromae]|uniref:Phosphoglycerate mutase-like protein n=1 Tax=Ceratobasidium theobromae TaxID=1582974 RepID=A0A5N5QID2_9AGAM|nr:hypothetical protein CTheo_5313 [Ceratobasidium theobromae]
MTSLDPSHLPEFGWKPHDQSKLQGEASYDQSYSKSLPIRTLPDLRFEQSYLLSLKLFIHPRTNAAALDEKSKTREVIDQPVAEGTALAELSRLDIATRGAGVSKYGVPERIEWGNIIWVVSPLFQGVVWGTASIFLGPLSKKLAVSLREMLVGPSSQQSQPVPTSKPQGENSMGWLRSWGRSLGMGANANSTFCPTNMGPLNEKEYNVAPLNLKLEQVHVYVRHGERTPVGVRMTGPPASIPAFWDMCKSARRFKATILGNGDASEAFEVQRLSERSNGYAKEGECLPGELTDVGRKSTLRLGEELRKLYVDRLSLLPDVLDSHHIAYFRSTNMPRTIETLQQVIYGIYPKSKIGEGFVPHVRSRHPSTENLIGNTAGCGRLAELALAFNIAAARDNNPKLEQFDSRLSKYIGGNPIRIDGKPRLSGIMDTIRAADVHGIRIPPEFRDPSLERAICDEWFRGYKDNEFRRLAMGRLLSEMTEGMNSLANGTMAPKIRVLACHDTTLAGLCTTLDVFNNRWPDFAASITFELFSESAPQPVQPTFSLGIFAKKPISNHFVRMRYQNRNLALPACAAPNDHLPGFPEFCTLTAFREHVRKLTPDDWEKECIPKGSVKPK